MLKLKWVPFFLASGYTSFTRLVSSFKVASILKGSKRSVVKFYTYIKYDCKNVLILLGYKMKIILNYIKDISPCVYLEFTRGNISSGKFIRSVMSTTVGGENTQEEGAGLWKKFMQIEILYECMMYSLLILLTSKYYTVACIKIQEHSKIK